ncbi:MAG: helix-turn-helix domain-containing protein [Acidobacteriia bacterium]|nr:helix-turn-helix domain-containing protein [Terriglobia bacterium]
MNTVTHTPLYYTPSQIAKTLQVQRRTIYLWIKDKKLRALGGHFKTGHRGSLQNRPTDHHPGQTCFTLPAGCLARPV